jgi:hypothetical protein
MGMKDIVVFLMPQSFEPFKSQLAFILKQLNSDSDDADSEEDGNVFASFFLLVSIVFVLLTFLSLLCVVIMVVIDLSDELDDDLLEATIEPEDDVGVEEDQDELLPTSLTSLPRGETLLSMFDLGAPHFRLKHRVNMVCS